MKENFWVMFSAGCTFFAMLLGWVGWYGLQKKKMPDLIKSSIDASNKVQTDLYDLRNKAQTQEANKRDEVNKAFFKLLHTETKNNTERLTGSIEKLTETITGMDGINSRMASLKTDVDNIKSNCKYCKGD